MGGCATCDILPPSAQYKLIKRVRLSSLALTELLSNMASSERATSVGSNSSDRLPSRFQRPSDQDDSGDDADGSSEEPTSDDDSSDSEANSDANSDANSNSEEESSDDGAGGQQSNEGSDESTSDSSTSSDSDARERIKARPRLKPTGVKRGRTSQGLPGDMQNA